MSSKTSFNRFSTFVKSGGENYILGKLNAKVQEADIIQVVVRGQRNCKFKEIRSTYVALKVRNIIIQ